MDNLVFPDCMNHPLISVITVVYNARLTLEATLKSVISQNKDFVEYWVIDGGSTDGSIELIRQYESELAGWLSEPDEGIYDAMNKGIDRANGQWIYFLGADDELITELSEVVIPNLKSTYSIVYGHVVYDNGYPMYSMFNRRLLLENTLHHQSAFYHRNLFSSFRYNPSLRVVGDYELNLRAYLAGVSTLRIPQTIARCGSQGVSNVLSSKETNRVRSLYIINPIIRRALNITLDAYYSYVRSRRLMMATLRNTLKRRLSDTI